MKENKRAIARQALDQLFKSLAIEKIVCVDDVYALSIGPEDAIGLIDMLDHKVATAITGNSDIPFCEERDVWVEPFNEFWEILGVPERTALLNKLFSAAAQVDPSIAGNAQDQKSASALSELFDGQEFLELSFTQWLTQKDVCLREAEAKKTLFLFDEDLSKDGGTTTGGRQLIREVLASAEAKSAMCGLLSHNILPEREFDIWSDFTSDDYGFDSERVVPVSKRTLETNPLEFARAIKLTVLNPDCHALAKLSGEVMEKSHAKAQERLEEINIFAFDHMVFRASNREGIWEPDTLFRLYNLFQRLEAREQAKKNPEFRLLADKIRSVSDIPTEMSPNNRPDDAWRIQRMELYETAEFINSNHLPVELGDIFEKAGQDGAEATQYILLAQPCDLMVRTDTGRRKQTMTHVVLAQLNKSQPSESFILPHFDPDNDKPTYVDFTATHLVSLNALDLCAFNSEGVASIKLSDKSDHLVLAWRKHYADLLDYFGQLIANRIQIDKSLSHFNEGKEPNEQIPATILDSFTSESSGASLFCLKIDLATTTVTFNCKRVGRFEPNHAAALWTKFCNFSSRAAFEVDFGS